jgi:coenzyme Q-binding protein COQ10
MTYSTQRKVLPYSAKDLFELVLDVARYSEFLPWCKASEIISQDKESMVADLTIIYKGFVDKYRSRITTSVNDQIYRPNLHNCHPEACAGSKSVDSEILNQVQDDDNASGAFTIYSINVEAISGPFKFLRNNWKFTDQDTASSPALDTSEFSANSAFSRTSVRSADSSLNSSCLKLNEFSCNGCLVEFMISFEFKNPFVDKLAGLFFKNATEKMVASFEARAKEVIG